MAPRPLFSPGVIPFAGPTVPRGMEELERLPPGIDPNTGQPQQRSPLAGLLNTLSPQERSVFLSSVLGGAGGNVSNLLAARPNAGIGQLLLATGSGALGGHMQGLQGIQLGKERELQTKHAERQIAMQESEIERKEAEAARRQRIFERMPPEMRAVAELADAGVSATALDRMFPKPAEPGRPFGSDALGYFTLGPDGKPQQVVPGLGRAAGSGDNFDRFRVVNGELIDLTNPTQPVYTSKQGEGMEAARKFWAQAYEDARKPSFEGGDGLDDAAARLRADQLTTEVFQQSVRTPTPQAAPAVTAAAEPEQTWGEYFQSWLPGGGEEEAPQTAVASQPSGIRQQMEANRAAQAQQQAADLPMQAGTTTPDAARLKQGQSYRLPSGEIATWDGNQFVVN